MSDETVGTAFLAAWRDEEFAAIIPDDSGGIGRNLVKEMARSQTLGSLVLSLQIELYKEVGSRANSYNEETGEPVGPIVGPLEFFGEPVPTLPVGHFTIFCGPDAAGEWEAEGIEEMDPEYATQVEAAAILASLSREIEAEGDHGSEG